jgi:DNA-directed RNA polymerase specialized sigma24 family protein
MNDVLMHVGTPHEGMTPHSGRYPFGSGEHGHQRDTSFLYRVEEYKKAGITDEKKLVEALGLKSTTEYRDLLSNAKAADRAAKVARASHLYNDKHLGYTEIGREMGVNESTVRSWLNPEIKERAEIGRNTAQMLKENVDKKKYIDVGVGVENWLGISQTKLRAAVKSLEKEGYHVETLYVEQLGTGKQTTLKVLCGPDTTWADVSKNRDKISLCTQYTENGGRSYLNLEKPVSVDSKRIQINYESPKDGVIELRRGVPDISLGNASYAQVRIAVDGTHYLKGMAMYSDKMPKGIDIMFNTNKAEGTPKEKVFKELKSDKDNPFGATIKPEEKLQLAQRHYIDENGKRKLSAVNIVNEEGDWANWSKSLSSQFLSKQSSVMAKKQLDLAYANQNDEFSTIKNLTNPIIKQKLLDQFADDCDSKAVHLKAAGLPRQASHVILPFPNMKPTEVYAPNYRDGERVVLIRYPHGGKFEIPELTVNNNNREAKKTLGKSPDAIGINQQVAHRLSGADFDGDTVLVIPVNRKVKVDTINPEKSKYFKDLQDFDPQIAYKGYDGMKVMTSRQKGIEMGRVSNLITDMTLQNASEEEIARAVKHSMVVIDAEKHKLNWQQSEKDFGIRQLMKKYQGSAMGGASTLISRASSEQRVPARKEKRPSQMTPDELKRYYEGEKIWEYTGKTYPDKKTGEIKGSVIKSTKAYEIDDAYKLTSGGSKQNPGTVIESVYAAHSNKMKALGNAARKESRAIEMPPVNSSAKKAYAAEVASLNAKWNEGMKNKPLERQAQLIANKTVAAKRASNPDMDADDVKRLRAQALDAARHRVGKPAYVLNITDREWEAIQANAVSSTKLKQIIDFADADAVKQRAMPRDTRGLTSSQKSRVKAMYAAGYTQREIADKLGVSLSTVSNVL